VKQGEKKNAGDTKAAPEKALKDIMARLRQQGASAVKLIHVSEIVIDERVRLKCQIPLCDSYNKNLMCPPVCRLFPGSPLTLYKSNSDTGNGAAAGCHNR
jgi:hypothetical protein